MVLSIYGGGGGNSSDVPSPPTMELKLGSIVLIQRFKLSNAVGIHTYV